MFDPICLGCPNKCRYNKELKNENRCMLAEELYPADADIWISLRIIRDSKEKPLINHIRNKLPEA